jgi:hypothetical protein
MRSLCLAKWLIKAYRIGDPWPTCLAGKRCAALRGIDWKNTFATLVSAHFVA